MGQDRGTDPRVSLGQGRSLSLAAAAADEFRQDQIMQRPSGTDVAGLELVTEVASSIRGAMATVIEGKPDVINTAITVLLAEGHLLIEDVPGVGKTMLAKALARSIDCSVRRVQFTPDLLPSDITGVSVFNQDLRDFEFRPGAIFANVVVGDEINRASPKTQSALLECMEEGQVTVDGQTYELRKPFIVMATQNPIEMEGTYPLPEAQRDRFMARISMGYPSAAAEIAMLESHGGAFPLEEMASVTDGDTVAKLIETVRTVHASRGHQAVCRGPHQRNACHARAAPGRLAARQPAPAARVPGVCRPRRTRPRPSRRRAGPGRARPGPQGDPGW